MGALIDFVGIFQYLFSFLPVPIAVLSLGLLTLCSIFAILRVIAFVLDLIPFA